MPNPYLLQRYGAAVIANLLHNDDGEPEDASSRVAPAARADDDGGEDERHQGAAGSSTVPEGTGAYVQLTKLSLTDRVALLADLDDDEDDDEVDASIGYSVFPHAMHLMQTVFMPTSRTGVDLAHREDDARVAVVEDDDDASMQLRGARPAAQPSSATAAAAAPTTLFPGPPPGASERGAAEADGHGARDSSSRPAFRDSDVVAKARQSEIEELIAQTRAAMKAAALLSSAPPPPAQSTTAWGSGPAFHAELQSERSNAGNSAAVDDALMGYPQVLPHISESNAAEPTPEVTMGTQGQADTRAPAAAPIAISQPPPRNAHSINSPPPPASSDVATAVGDASRGNVGPSPSKLVNPPAQEAPPTPPPVQTNSGLNSSVDVAVMRAQASPVTHQLTVAPLSPADAAVMAALHLQRRVPIPALLPAPICTAEPKPTAVEQPTDVPAASAHTGHRRSETSPSHRRQHTTSKTNRGGESQQRQASGDEKKPKAASAKAESMLPAAAVETIVKSVYAILADRERRDERPSDASVAPAKQRSDIGRLPPRVPSPSSAEAIAGEPRVDPHVIFPAHPHRFASTELVHSSTTRDADFASSSVTPRTPEGVVSSGELKRVGVSPFAVQELGAAGGGRAVIVAPTHGANAALPEERPPRGQGSPERSMPLLHSRLLQPTESWTQRRAAKEAETRHKHADVSSAAITVRNAALTRAERVARLNRAADRLLHRRAPPQPTSATVSS